MNNYCRNCGKKLEIGEKKCTNCDAEVFEDRINVESKKKELAEYKKKENSYIISIISLYVLSYLSKNVLYFDFLSSFRPLIFLAATVILIYARITMNNSKKIKIMFNIFIFLIIMGFLFIVLLFMTCANAINEGCY